MSKLGPMHGFLAVEDGLGEVGHGVAGLGRDPRGWRRSTSRPSGTGAAWLGEVVPTDRDLPDEPLLADRLGGAGPALAAEAEEGLDVRVGGDDVEGRLAGQRSGPRRPG